MEGGQGSGQLLSLRFGFCWLVFSTMLCFLYTFATRHMFHAAVYSHTADGRSKERGHLLIREMSRRAGMSDGTVL